MNFPIPFSEKVLIKRKKQEPCKIIIANQNALNQGTIVSLPLDNKTNLNIGDEITFEYCVPTTFKLDKEDEYSLVPLHAILLVLND